MQKKIPTVNPVIRVHNDYIERAQKWCKLFRSEICNLSLDGMARIYGLNRTALSAWENGKANKADYLFYYYDLCNTEEMRLTFLRIVFMTDKEDFVLNSTKDFTNGCTNFSITFKPRD